MYWPVLSVFLSLSTRKLVSCSLLEHWIFFRVCSSFTNVYLCHFIFKEDMQIMGNLIKLSVFSLHLNSALKDPQRRAAVCCRGSLPAFVVGVVLLFALLLTVHFFETFKAKADEICLHDLVKHFMRESFHWNFLNDPVRLSFLLLFRNEWIITLFSPVK